MRGKTGPNKRKPWKWMEERVRKRFPQTTGNHRSIGKEESKLIPPGLPSWTPALYPFQLLHQKHEDDATALTERAPLRVPPPSFRCFSRGIQRLHARLRWEVLGLRLQKHCPLDWERRASCRVSSLLVGAGRRYIIGGVASPTNRYIGPRRSFT